MQKRYGNGVPTTPSPVQMVYAMCMQCEAARMNPLASQRIEIVKNRPKRHAGDSEPVCARRQTNEKSQKFRAKGIRRDRTMEDAGKRQRGLQGLGVADDNPRAFFPEHAPLFGLGAPISAFFATEEAEHARRLLPWWILYKGRTLIGHFSPGPRLVEDYLYASTHAGAAL